MRKTFTKRSLQSLVDLPDGGGHVIARLLAPAARVELPPLPTGQAMLAQLDVPTEPGGAHWTEDHYQSVAPVLIEFRDVLVHSATGIVCVDDQVIYNTMHQAEQALDGWAPEPDGTIALQLADDIVDLPGRHLSLLTGSAGNYYHWTMDGLGRLAALPTDEIEGCASVLHPAFTQDFQRDGFRRLGLALPALPVPNGATLRVERLVVPWSVLGEHRPHPSVSPLFQRLAQHPPPAAAPGLYPARLYIDRRGSQNRPLTNEAAVIDALTPRGFIAVRLEDYALSAQIALFAQAQIIVAPHGAGLTNLVYAGRQTKVIELLMDAWVNWCFRRLAALGGQDYDCVIGLEDRPADAPLSVWPHDRSWTVSVPHVLAAVDRALAA